MVLKCLGIGLASFVSLVLVFPVSIHAQSQAAPGGDKVCVDRQSLVSLKEEAAGHLQKARESFVKKDVKKAGDEIRKAAAFVRLESEAASADVKEGLLDAGQELKKLADNVESGAVKSVKELDDAFARARSAIGKLK